MGAFLSFLIHPTRSFPPTDPSDPSLPQSSSDPFHLAGVQTIMIRPDGSAIDSWELRSQLHTLPLRAGSQVAIYRDVDRQDASESIRPIVEGKIIRPTTYDKGSISYLVLDNISRDHVQLKVPRTKASVINLWEKLHCQFTVGDFTPRPPSPVLTKRNTHSMPAARTVTSLDLECGMVRMVWFPII
jgi:hypothetical protein